jgi:hypothetical protein
MQCRVAVSLVVLVCIAFSVACSPAVDRKSVVGRAASKNESTQPGVPNVVTARPLSEQDCRDFAQSVSNAVAAGDLVALNALFDWHHVSDVVLNGMELTTKRRQDLALELRTGVSRESSFTSQMIKNVGAGGTLRCLRTRQDHQRQVVLYRMLGPGRSGGLDYVEFVPGRSGDGNVRAVDVYFFSTAEFFTTTYRRVLLPILANESRGFVDRLITGERDFVHDFPQVVQMAGLIDRGQMRGALEIVRSLRPETRRQKAVLMNRLRAAQEMNDNEYSAVLEEFRQAYPQDPCLDLLLIDYYALKNDFVRAKESIDRLDKAVGGDPYLNVLRANLSMVGGDLKAARDFAKFAIKEELGLIPAYLSLLAVSLREENFKESLDLLKMLDQEFKLAFNDLTTVSEYAGFVKTPQYQEWLKYLAQRAGQEKAKPSRAPAATKKTPVAKQAGSAS